VARTPTKFGSRELLLCIGLRLQVCFEAVDFLMTGGVVVHSIREKMSKWCADKKG